MENQNESPLDEGKVAKINNMTSDRSMTKEEAIKKSLLRPNNYRFPSMIESKRAMRAMDLYCESKIEKINLIHTMPADELNSKLLELLYKGGTNQIVKFIKGEI